ncbi:MAG: hypothetical protein OQJ93_01395 [Ignavibacteriaceae bacterium]|jgi:hypothetical protein|nr:hypothetical protein [Ignavibacteriaceae bacterium]MCW8814095.1 hypothetical protein [Chlorobium sp.]MCW8817783.1 hypothetical protein [Ignavibacteriaceae bacterium]MCW8823987.1 hypothetical protein [Ignavibacteriaceae bacterium]MCW8960802.1 hypothetical protein [Ignavibacteriaceae bacterium]
MKKGCFLNAVIIGTILIAAAVYIIENKFDEWFLKPGKELVLNEIINNWDNEFKYIQASSQKDSLKNLLVYYVDNIKSLDEVVHTNEKSFANEFESVIEDSLITKNEISKLTTLVKKELNEESKGN